MLAERTFHVIFVSRSKPTGFAWDAKAGRTVRYCGTALQLKPWRRLIARILMMRYRTILAFILSAAVCAGSVLAVAAQPDAAPTSSPAAAAPTGPNGEAPNQYKSFAVTVYCVVGTLVPSGGGRGRGAVGVGDAPDLTQLEATWKTVSEQLKIDKVYIETVRDQNEMPENYIEPLKKFFTDRRVRVAGGMTLAQNNSGQYTTYNYSRDADRATVKRLSEMTARHFDEIILDDFFFYNTKTDSDISAKGDRSWTEFRVATMQDVAKNFVVEPAHAVNPKVKMVVKYPNWYEHFQANGYDLDKEPFIFDGVYTGTETRDPVRTEQHLQPYQSYQLFRYLENIRPGGNGGGWVDLGQYNVADRYAEQLWDTVFAKAPEMMLFNWSNLTSPIRQGNRPWASKMTSFNWEELVRQAAGDPPPRSRGGAPEGVGPTPSVARTASYALTMADKVVYQLGTPIGIKSYRPPHGTGEDFLHNYLGMVGLPIDLYPTYPAEAPLVLLTEDARADKDILAKIKASLMAGHNVVVTSGFVRSMGKQFRDLAEVELTGAHIPVTSFHGVNGNPLAGSEIAKPILFPEISFITNDAWYVLAGVAGGNGYPILISDKYSRGTLYVLTIPDAFTDLYNMPAAALGVIRNTLCQGLPVALTGATPAYVSLFEYDNGTFIVQNFGDEDKAVSVGVAGASSLKNMLTNQVLSGTAPVVGGRGFGGGPQVGPQRTTFTLTVPAHSWVALSTVN